MSSIPNPPEHTNENTMKTATHTRIGTRLRPSVTSVILPPPSARLTRTRRRAAPAPGPHSAHTILLAMGTKRR